MQTDDKNDGKKDFCKKDPKSDKLQSHDWLHALAVAFFVCIFSYLHYFKRNQMQQPVSLTSRINQ